MKPNTPIDELEISVRSFGVLQALGVKSLADLARLSAEDVLAAPHATKLVLAELNEILTEVGLKFRD